MFVLFFMQQTSCFFWLFGNVSQLASSSVMPSVKQLNESVVTVILSIEDHKNLYSSNHSFSLRLNGQTMTSSTGIAFNHQNEIFVISDANMFDPYFDNAKHCKANIKIHIQFNKRLKIEECDAIIVGMEHLMHLQHKIQNKQHTHFHFGQQKFAYFVLLKLKKNKKNDKIQNHLFEFVDFDFDFLQIGSSIVSISSPFAILCRNVLCNMMNDGTLSTFIAECVWLSDIKYFDGMNGALIASSDGKIFGVMSTPLMIGNDDKMSTIIPFGIVCSWIAKKLKISFDCNTKMNQKKHDFAKSVVPILIGNHWASAIIISQIDIFTNAHIVRPYLDKSINPKVGVFVDETFRKWVECKIKYVTHCDSPFDFAWIQMMQNVDFMNKHRPIRLKTTTKNGKFAMNEYERLFDGHSKVFAIGFGAIHPLNCMPPLICRGILSQIVYDDDNERVVCLKTSANVRCGQSGGLLCDESGNCLGILTNNTRFDEDKNDEKSWENEEKNGGKKKGKSKIFHSLNSVLPFSVIYDLYKCVIEGANDEKFEKVFADLDKPNIGIEAKWNLISPEKLKQEMMYDEKMQSIVDKIPKHLFSKDTNAKL